MKMYFYSYLFNIDDTAESDDTQVCGGSHQLNIDRGSKGKN